MECGQGGSKKTYSVEAPLVKETSVPPLLITQYCQCPSAPLHRRLNYKYTHRIIISFNPKQASVLSYPISNARNVVALDLGSP